MHVRQPRQGTRAVRVEDTPSLEYPTNDQIYELLRAAVISCQCGGSCPCISFTVSGSNGFAALLCPKFQAALARGLELAELNVAIVLELEGSTAQSVNRFEKVLHRMRANDLPDRHVMIKMATVGVFFYLACGRHFQVAAITKSARVFLPLLRSMNCTAGGWFARNYSPGNNRMGRK